MKLIKTKKSLIDYLNCDFASTGFVFDDFQRMIERGVNDVNIAKAFEVDRRTVKKWRALYENE